MNPSVRPKKHLGQHFLRDENIAKKIVDSLPDGTKDIIEVGPGMGILTKYLVAKPGLNAYFIETDPEASKFLVNRFPEFSDRIILADFLHYNIGGLFPATFDIIGNFPYNISSQILFKVLEYRDQVDCLVGMVQKEVAERIASPPGNKKYGILSVLLQAFYSIEYLFTVNETVFIPKPRVKSAVIRLKRNGTAHLECDEEIFFRVVKAAFNQRRKMLRNSLQQFDLDYGAEFPEYEQKRPEQLQVEDFTRIAAGVKNG
jgi:16S rRNA (adenine1518-N6/adenine1519-N6)-dimethyltransferase